MWVLFRLSYGGRDNAHFIGHPHAAGVRKWGLDCIISFKRIQNIHDRPMHNLPRPSLTIPKLRTFAIPKHVLQPRNRACGASPAFTNESVRRPGTLSKRNSSRFNVPRRSRRSRAVFQFFFWFGNVNIPHPFCACTLGGPFPPSNLYVCGSTKCRHSSIQDSSRFQVVLYRYLRLGVL